MRPARPTFLVLAAALCVWTAAAEEKKPAAVEEPAWVIDLRAKIKKSSGLDQRNAKHMPPIAYRQNSTTIFNYKISAIGVSGAQVVYDPVGQQALVIGGMWGGQAEGYAGNWRVNENLEWTRWNPRSPVLEPLRVQLVEARMPARDGENAARNVFFAAFEAAKEAEALKGRPAELLADAIKKTEATVASLGAAKAEGWEGEGLRQARVFALEGLGLLKAAHGEIAAGKISAEILAQCFDGQWKLDEAAGCLASHPGAAFNPFAAYDPVHKCVIVYGGSHGDYLTSDTWIYDCEKQAWRRVWAKPSPPPMCAFGSNARSRIKTPFEMIFDPATKSFSLSGGFTMIDNITQQAGYVKEGAEGWRFDAGAGKWSREGGSVETSGEVGAPWARTYRTVCPHHDPRWYDREARGSRAETEAWQKALPVNTWSHVSVPPGKRTMSSQSWGTMIHMPERELMIYQSGGHDADPTDIVPMYHPAINRWSIGYVPAMTHKGIGFDGRPDCMNHTYKLYSYDPISKKVIHLTTGGTAVYNLDRNDFDYTINTPFHAPYYATGTVGTPKGVFAWSPGRLFLFNEKDRAWSPVKFDGKVGGGLAQGYGITYDPKRDAVWMLAPTTHPPKPLEWRYRRLDLKTMKVEKVEAKNEEAIAFKLGVTRESTYVPERDLIILNSFLDSKQVAFDCATNTWVTLNIEKPKNATFRHLGMSGGGGLVYDPGRKLLWYSGTFGSMYALRLDAAALKFE